MAKQIRSTVVDFVGSTDVRTIRECHAKVLQALQHHKSIQIDLAQATEPDLTLVQLIESARRFAIASGKDVALAQPADAALRDVLVRGGFLAAAPERAFWLHETRAS